MTDPPGSPLPAPSSAPGPGPLAPAGDPGARVPGLVPVALVSRGRTGALWRCRETATGDTVAVRIGARPPGPLTGAAAAREVRLVAALREVDSPHVVRMRRVVDLPAGRRALVSDWVSGRDLAQVLAGGALEVGAAVTVGVGVARGLAALHGCGVEHGALDAGCVRFGPAGRPLLVDAGASLLLGSSDAMEGGPAADVAALGDLLDLLAAAPHWQHDVARLALANLADACRDPREEDRPEPAEVARRVWAVATAIPVPGVAAPSRAAGAPTVVPLPVAGGGSGASRRRAVGGGVLVAAVAAGVAGWSYGVPRSAPAQPAVQAAALDARDAAPSAPAARPDAGPDFRVVVERLAHDRAAVLTGAAGSLASVDEPGSPAWAADARLLRALSRHRLRLDRLRFEVDAVRVVARSRERGREVVTVRCTVAVAEHVRVPTAPGSVVGGRAERVPAQAPRQVRLVLVGAGGRWLVRAVT